MLENTLKRLRAERQYTQEDVAQHLRIPRPSYSEIESGKRKIHLQEILALLDLYKISFEELTGKNRFTNRGKEIGKFLNLLWALKETDKKSFFEHGFIALIELINGKPKTKKK